MRIGRLVMKGTCGPLVLLETFRLLAFALLLGFCAPANAAPEATGNPANQPRRAASLALESKAKPRPGLYIDRKGRKLYTIDASGAVTAQYPIGIGKGSIKRTKRSMSDNITPIGDDFKVELILSKNANFNGIDSSFQKRYRSSPQFFSLVNSKSGLAQLFKNMNSIDFDGDGKPDGAYGAAYIGLTSRTAVTGPKLRPYAISTSKMRVHARVPYWHSIAIHGTPNPDRAIGQATSCGCVHLGEDALMKLIGEKFVKVGTPVTIADAPPS